MKKRSNQLKKREVFLKYEHQERIITHTQTKRERKGIQKRIIIIFNHPITYTKKT